MVMIEDSDIKIIRFNESNNNSSIRIVVDVEEFTVAAAAAKVKRRWMIMEESKRGEDPVEKLGDDLMREILGMLDARSLAVTLLVSRSWCSLASSDSLWSPLCEQLWIGKAHIPRCSKVPGLSKLASYSRAIVDSKRVRVMSDDLCDHAWAFHFGEAAPDYWKDLDPYWGSIGRPMHRHFHPDGSISADIEDTVWGGHESSYSIVTNIYENGEIGENYVRINCWPRLTVSRREDWGWEMSNSVCAYSSVPDASKGETGPVFDFKDHFF